MAFGITYEIVASAADQLRAQNTALAGVVEKMKNTAQRRFANWNALSVDTYVDAHTKWDGQAQLMQADLEANITRLYQIIANYQDGDRRASGGM